MVLALWNGFGGSIPSSRRGRKKSDRHFAAVDGATDDPKMTEIPPQCGEKSGIMSKILVYFRSQLMLKNRRLVSTTIYNLL